MKHTYFCTQLRRWLSYIVLVALLPSFAYAKEQANFISHTFKTGDFSLVSEQGVATLYVDQQDYKGVQRAAVNLQQDIAKVTGKTLPLQHAEVTSKLPIIIGTVGKSRYIKQLVDAGKLNIDSVKGQWEAFRIQLVVNPMPNVAQALVIVGSDKRGTTYGIYEISEKIGVSPWYWWADVPVKKASSLIVKQGTQLQDQPKVQYRGIFLNDEAPALTNWVNAKFGDFNHQFYEHVFELLLRLKANFLWPAMWNSAFSDDDPLNMVLADEYGIVMSNSHHEPMLCADKEWDRRGQGKWDYDVNPDNLYQFWQKCAARNKPYESIYTLGMRGQQDTPMSENENIDLLEKIVADQRDILSKTFTERPLSEVPQVWTLYKEVQSYYEKGMRVPDDVTLLWSDDNWGNIRRLPTADERSRAGGAGVYYHFDYVGGPRSYRWINTTQISKIWQQMDLAYRHNAKKIWVVNVGDLKPMEYPIDFFLTMAWDPERFDEQQLPAYNFSWVKQQFGEKFAAQIVDILSAYTRHNARSKPELVDENTYSLLNYNEFDRISDELQSYADQAQSISEQLPADQHAAFFQLVLHPIKATSNLFNMYKHVAKNRLYAHQGRATANQYADAAKSNFASDKALKQQYHQLKDGRWNHFMDQTHIGYTYWNNPPEDILPWLAVNEPAAVADMGVTVEGDSGYWPSKKGLTLDTFSPYGQTQRYIDIYNKGTKEFAITVTPSDPWIKISEHKGKVSKQQRLYVSIDWQLAPQGKTTGFVEIKGTGWGSAKVNVASFNPQQKVTGFVEADGYIAMNATSAKTVSRDKGFNWQSIPGYGRVDSAMHSRSIDVDRSVSDIKQGAYLEFDTYFFSTGQFELQVLAAPSNQYVPNRGMRFAIAIDEQTPQVIDILKNNTHRDWQQSVRENSRKLIGQIQVKQQGKHKLRLYMVDSDVVIEKVIINTGGLKESYLGPVPSTYIN